MHNISPTTPVLGDPLQLFPAQPRLRDGCIKVTPSGVLRSPPLSLALRVPCQGLSRNVTIGVVFFAVGKCLQHIRRIYLRNQSDKRLFNIVSLRSKTQVGYVRIRDMMFADDAE